ncbi:TPA: hypothetical protein N3H93_003209 [Salmonella enterica subsp. enterica serovar Anatum]|nr:hypothetical protein [Salmonella enterica subsp. enterica serovar Anatum]
MSTITKERLTELSRRENVGAILGEEIAELARIALASLEAEPVCVIDQSNLDYLKSGSDADVWPASRTEMGDVLLYRTAPPAPVSVPAAMEMDDDFDSSFEHGKAVGWNACRDAMLQGKSELPAYEIKRFGDFSARSFGLEIGELTTSIQLFHFDRGTTPEPKHRGSFVYKYALQAIINTLQQQCDELSDTPVTVIWPAAPQQEVKS